MNSNTNTDISEIRQEALYMLAIGDPEILSLSQKYDPLGLDQKSLLIKLKVLKDAGVLEDEVAFLDQQLVNLPLLALEKARAKARELMKSRPELNLEKATDIILEDEPELKAQMDR